MTRSQDFYDARLPASEFAQRHREMIATLDGTDGDEMRAFVAWFTRRYPTPLERIAYCRRKYQESIATRGRALPR